MRISRRRLVLAIVATDRTFEHVELRGQPAWVGKCLHCRSAVAVTPDGEMLGTATIEHIVPRAHGGGDTPENLALACARCNSLKGVRHDARRPDDPRTAALIEGLKQKRRERWRAPIEELAQLLAPEEPREEPRRRRR